MATTAQGGSLISSSDVVGTDVYGTDGKKVGVIDHLMVDKVSGKVAYAVMNFGGFLGVGQDHRPVPWGVLSYDTSKGGFMSNLSKETIEGAPAHDSDWSSNRDWEEQTHRHYGTSAYWV